MAQRVYEEAYASARIFGEHLDPLDVTVALRLPADHTHRHGEPHLRRWPSGAVREYAPYRNGMWNMSSRQHVTSPRLAAHPFPAALDPACLDQLQMDPAQ